MLQVNFCYNDFMVIQQGLVQIGSTDQLDAILKANEIVIIDFFADWCPPCRAIAPKFEALSLDSSMSRVKFCKLNIDTLPNVGASYGIKSIPTFIIFFRSKEVSRLLGAAILDIKNSLIQQLEKLA